MATERTKRRPISEETRAKMSKSHMGHTRNKGKIPWNKGLKGQIPWNKGLSKETDKRVASYAKTVQLVQSTPEFRAKRSALLKGVPKSAEHKAKLVIAQTGKTMSDEAKAKISKANLGKIVPREVVARIAQTQKGKFVSLETRAKMAKFQTGRKHSPETCAKRSASIAQAFVEGRYNDHPSKYHHGSITLPRLGSTHHYRSSYEEKTLLLLDAYKEVAIINVEPFRIPYVDTNSKKRSYVPDMLVTLTDDTMLLIEVKPGNKLTKPNNVLKFKVGQAYAKYHHTKFCIFTEDEIFNNSNSVETTFSGVIQKATAATQLSLNKETSNV